MSHQLSGGEMTAVHTPRRRGGRAALGDARFFIGLALVAAAVAGVWFVVSSASRTEAALVATRTIVPGETIAPGDVREVEVVLGQAAESYLRPADIEFGSVSHRTIATGELIPSAALGGTAGDVTAIVVTSAMAVPAAVERGSLVELWAAAPAEQGRFHAPRVLVAEAVVSALSAETGMLATGAATVEVVIPRAEVARTLEAVASGSAISVVPVGGAG